MTFTRLGRGCPPPQTFDVSPDDGDGIARAVRAFAGKHLASRHFVVSVYTDGTGDVEDGRFGEFAWEEVPRG